MSAAEDFFDDFNRADGAPGNGWLLSPDNSGGSIGVLNGALTTSGAGGFVGFYRPMDLSQSVTISADLTSGSGFGGLRLRYTTGFMFGGDGTTMSGYGVLVYRGDENYNNSAVLLFHDGQSIGQILSPFQFGDHLHVLVRLEPNGSLQGAVSDSANVFNFAFTGPAPSFSAENFTIYVELTNPNAVSFPQATIDNLLIDIGSDGANEPLLFQQPLAMGAGTLFTGEPDGDGWTVTTNFGVPTASKLAGHGGHKHYHLGEDWVPEKGQPVDADVFAVANGIVVYAQSHPFFGNTVVIAHDVSANGLGIETVYSLYAHLDSIQVVLGDIDRGETIGVIGKTGAANGIHLHWEMFSADWATYLSGALVGYSEQLISSQWFDPTDFVSGFVPADTTMPGVLMADHSFLML